jgi:hypothetical protein
MINKEIYVLRFCIFLLLCLLLKSACAESFFDFKDKKVIDDIYKETYYFQFQKVDSLIHANEVLYKDNLGFNLAVVNYYWWRLISGEQNGKYADLVSERIETIEVTYSKKNTKIGDAELFLLVSIFAYNARVSLVDNSYFAAISNLSKYYTFIKMSIGSEPKYNPFYLTSGLYFFFSGLAKERAPVLSPFLNQYSTGNMVTGLNYIKIASSSEDWKISQEAKYFLMKINFDVYRNFTEAAKYCNQLMEAYPENLLFQLYMFRISLALDQVAYAKARMAIMEKTAGNNHQLTTDEKEFYIKQAKADLEAFSKKKL